MTTRLVGQPDWRMTRDDEGHRTYTLTSLVEADTSDGPANVLETPGLPFPGSSWQIASDLDIWAWCLPGAEVDKHQAPPGDPHRWWTVKQKFTTKPPPLNQQRCGDQEIKDPLLEPPKISGTYHREHKEATITRQGWPIRNSAHEPIRGPQVTFDESRGQIKIQQNIADPFYGYVLPGLFIDCVNAFPLWGLPPRCIKLSNAPWERKFYGFCSIYYQRTLEFDTNGNTFDRDILDEGTKVLHGHWDTTTGKWVLDRLPDGTLPQYYNPQHFDRYLDRQGNAARVILNGHGVPAGTLKVGGRLNRTPRDPTIPLNPNAAATWSQLVTRINRWTLATAGQPLLTLFTAQPHGLSATQVVQIADANGQGAEQVNGTWLVASTTLTSIVLQGTAGIQTTGLQGGTLWKRGDVLDINTTTSPITCFSPGNNIDPTVQVFIEGARQDTGANGNWFTTGGDTFPLLGSLATSPAVPGTGTATEEQSTAPGIIYVEKYNEVDFTLLGIPLIF